MLTRFSDPDNGGFFFTSEAHETLLARSKDPTDKALPSGSGIAVQVLARLKMWKAAQDTVESSLFFLKRAPVGMQSTALGLALLIEGRPQDPIASEDSPTGERVVHLKKRQAPFSVKASLTHLPQTSEATLRVQLSLDAGWHVQSHEPGPKGMLPSSLFLDGLVSAKGASSSLPQLATIEYPEGELLRFPFLPAPVRVWSQDVVLRAKVIQLDSKLGLPLRLKMQPCDETRCLEPVVLQLDFPPRGP